MWDLKKFGAKSIPALKATWAVVNSPLVITLVSGLLIAAIAQGYTKRDAAARDLQMRRNKLATSLAEFQQRVAYLQTGDNMWKGRCDYVVASQWEWEAITGTANYVPTSPLYRGVHLNVVLNDVEISSGVPDIRYGVAMFIRAFSVPPPRTAIWVRGQMQWLRNYGSSRSLLFASGHLPVVSGQRPAELTRTLLQLPGSTLSLPAKMDENAAKSAEFFNEEIQKAAERNQKPCREPQRH